MAETGRLRDALQSKQEQFLHHNPSIHNAALHSVKQYLDPILASPPILAPSAKRSKRQWQQSALYVDGFDVDQVWEQVKTLVQNLVKDVALSDASIKITNSKSTNKAKSKRKFAQYSDEEVEGEEEEDENANISPSENGEDEDQVESEEEDAEDDMMEEQDVEDPEMEEDEAEDLDMGDFDEEELGEDSEDDEGAAIGEPQRPLIKDKHGLNDGFFSIDDFNRETEQFENMDANGMPPGSDDESVDYNADPDLEGDEDSGDDEGDDESEGSQDESGNGDIMYKDFFAPPARSKSKPNTGRKPNGSKNESRSQRVPDLSNVEADMDRVRRDLFEEDEDDFDGEEEEDEEGEGTLATQSSHSKRQATLIDQIRQLEAANVAKRDWTLSGEARAKERPLNSLLEEDLDFETTGKPVPIITKDVTDDLETKIKNRIIAEDFDEVLKRRPEDVSSSFRRGRTELDDSKSQKSLAQIYEEDHLRKLDPENHPEAADTKLEAQHKEIELLFADVVKKLDSLSSWHYTPKPAKPSLSVVADVRTLDMEEAQPASTGTNMLNSTSQLAPQEVYAPGSGVKEHLKATGEILASTGAPIAVREMTTDEKKRRRRREKERHHKMQVDNAGGVVTKGVKEGTSKKATVDALKRGGVTLIGKHGEKSDLDGKKVKGGKQASANSFLL